MLFCPNKHPVRIININRHLIYFSLKGFLVLICIALRVLFSQAPVLHGF